VSRRLDADALRSLAKLETADADAIVQRLEEEGAKVRDPSAYVSKAAKRLRRPGVAPPLPDGADPRKVYVGNILYTASDPEIKDLFAAVGEVTAMKMPVSPTGAPKGVCFITFASAEAATRAVATMNNAEFKGRKLIVHWCEPKGPCKFWTESGWCKDGDRCQFSHDGPQARGRGGFGDARSAAAPGDGGGHRGPAPPHAPPPRCFGPTALREAVRNRLDAPALRALAELETFDADAVVQCLEQAGSTVRNPSAYVCKAVDTVRRGRERGMAPRLDSLQSLPPPSARGNMAPRPGDYPRPANNQVLGDWICRDCGGNNFARRRECFRCGTVKPGGSTFEQKKYGSQVPPRRRSRSRSRERERRRRGRRS
jgi:hypothetical protein